MAEFARRREANRKDCILEMETSQLSRNKTKSGAIEKYKGKNGRVKRLGCKFASLSLSLISNVVSE